MHYKPDDKTFKENREHVKSFWRLFVAFIKQCEKKKIAI